MPELSFTVVDIAPEPYAAAPNLIARLLVWRVARRVPSEARA